MKKAVLYARVSSREQEKEGFSIPAQLKLLQEYATKNDIAVIEQFKEAETAKKSGREEFNRMIDFLKNKKEQYCILVEKTDRLYRNFKDYVKLEELDTEIYFVKEGEILSQDSKSHVKFIHGIKVLMAKNYIDNLSEEVKKGMKEKASQGHFPSAAPYGYKNNKNTRLIEIEPDEAFFVSRAFELYASGEYSVDTLREKLFEEGLRYTNSQKKIPRTTLETILKKPLYIGDFIWSGTYYKGKHEPIISPAQFKEVQAILSNRYKGQVTKHDFQFTGLLTCGECGRAYTAELKKKRYIYYHCSNRRCQWKNKNIREERIEEQLESFLTKLQTGTEIQDLIREALKESLSDEKDFHEQAVSSIEGQLKKVRTKIERIYEDKLEGVIPEELWQRKHQEYTQEQENLMKSLEEHQQGAKNYFETGIQLVELSKKALQLYKGAETNEKKRLLRFMSSNYKIVDEKIVPDWNPAFKVLLKSGDLEKWRGRWGSNPRPPA